MAIRFSAKIEEKLDKKHNVKMDEVEECFNNRCGELLLDTREQHQTNPPTQWFIAETNRGRLLKICFIQSGDDIHIKSSFPPNPKEIEIYNKYAKPIN